LKIAPGTDIAFKWLEESERKTDSINQMKKRRDFPLQNGYFPCFWIVGS
jgi:hypothetical protein